jgi:hypothetical protein
MLVTALKILGVLGAQTFVAVLCGPMSDFFLIRCRSVRCFWPGIATTDSHNLAGRFNLLCLYAYGGHKAGRCHIWPL